MVTQAETKCDEIRREGDPPHSHPRVCLTLSQKALDSSLKSTIMEAPTTSRVLLLGLPMVLL